MNDRINEPKFKHRLLANFFVRFHMTLILGAVCFSGAITSKLLLWLGVSLMTTRYLIAICIAYAIFFLLMRLWLWYIGISPGARKAISQSNNRRSSSSSLIGEGATFDLSPGDSGSGGSSWSGFGGGSSGGGGASDSWGETSEVTWLSPSPPSPASGSNSYQWGSATSGKSGSSFNLDFDLGDDGCLAIVVLLLLIALVLGIFGAGAYLIYQAPAIFAETAFQAALASGLIKASKDMDATDWKGSVFKATWLPFVVVMVLALAFSIAAHRYCPKATKATEVFKACK